MNETLIKFENFGFQYNAKSTPTLYDINLEIHRGEKILIAGQSGCGKSTLVHCMNGLIPFSYKGEMSGSLTIKGEETRSLDLFKISKSVGTVLQDSDAQFVGMTVAEDIAFALENDCIKEDAMKQRVASVAKLVNVDGLLKNAPRDLSGGQKQRVSMAGVMVDDVDILLFDEPLANLDPATGKRAVELIDELKMQTGATVIIVEHRIEDVLWKDVDRIVLMKDGRIIADTVPDELLASGILTENGIREPLYITALKYANVDVNPRQNIRSINTLVLTEEDRQKVRDWYDKPLEFDKKPRGDVQLSVKNVNFTYPGTARQILKDVSLDFYKGEMLAIVGTNGAGKSTFSNVICGFENQQSGTIDFNGIDFATLSIKERSDHVGYIMQNPNQMISQVMIKDEVALGLKMRGVSEAETEERVERVLKVCGLWRFRKWPISALSFGQKKRVTIASILVLEPEMIILDEPTAGQDYRHYTEIMEFLKMINSQGITTVMITHDMHIMLEYADRVVAFCDGRVIDEGSSARILTTDDIVERSSLKRTSLYDLARMCDIDDATGFVQKFIDYEETVVRSAQRGIDDAEHI